MRSSTLKSIALSLAAFLAVLAYCQHSLHDWAHLAGYAPSGCAHHCCSSDQHVAQVSGYENPADDVVPQDESERPSQHDSENCSICRLLALPQLNAPSVGPLAARLVAFDVVRCDEPLHLCRVARRFDIRGPPRICV